MSKTFLGLSIGDKIELVSMGNDPDPIQPGTTGTVIGWCASENVQLEQIWVKWDNGRQLNILPRVDKWRKI
jgi:hypothetical protein